MNFKLILFLPFFIFFNETNEESSYWGKNGHRVTGEIAETYLTKRTKKEIDKLLKGQSLAFVSTYADEIKSDKSFNKYYSWHYVNMSLNETYEQSEKNPKGDLVTGISECISVLKDKNSTADDKAFHLKMLVHFIGDLHQPMHVGRKEDKGGNTIRLKWFGKGTNLHRVWDDNMIESYDMSYSDLANNAEYLSKEAVKLIEKGSVVDWVNEVHTLSKEVYNSVEVGENLRYNYSYLYLNIARKQLQIGGIRLAKVLNDIFD